MRHSGPDRRPLRHQCIGHLDRDRRGGGSIPLRRRSGLGVCIEAANRTPWSSGARTFHVQCAVTVLTDDPVAVNVIYRDTNAAMDPKGPTLAITAMPWTGILNAQPVGAK